ncbi:MAG: glycerophosphoryl diester phosphodiesterase [Cellvibrionaceae bacterium]|jgi:glycerophosphoryl diester phosphodiesterase
MSSWFVPRSNKPIIIAHRGASQEMPENTMGAFRLAVDQGADGLEFDVQFSADGVPMIIHDPTLDRTTNGRGRVIDQPFRQLQRYDAGGGERISSLEELFSEFGSNTLYNIEIKSYTFKDIGVEKAVADLIGRFKLGKQVLVSSFFPANLRRFSQHSNPPAVLTGLVRYKGFGFTRHFYQGQVDHPWHQLVDAKYMHWAAENNLRVHVWTVDDLDEATRLTKLGVHGIITNRPGYLQTHL